ncbi:MAG: AmmeMemoRadiSam system protein B [Spirochaetaceae bacterium]|nr:MAG: AmmeMemoRadiSam system protein B [Spirochaetaceae bacterium]
MKIRPRNLPPGWYPGGEEQTVREIERFRSSPEQAHRSGIAGVAPHAGWSYSGSIACHVFQSISERVQTIVVVGGHLAPHSGLLAAFEDGYETPLGVLESDGELLKALRDTLSLHEDRYADNTVEVQLPLLKYLHPDARALYLRASPSEEALKLGVELAAAAGRLNRQIAVVGSTDLTHYGDNYGFTPHGTGPGAVKWVKEVNDRRIVEALLAVELEKALDLARREQSACSVGGAVAAARFAQAMGAVRGELLEYRTSYDIAPSSFFVGYAGIIYSRTA